MFIIYNRGAFIKVGRDSKAESGSIIHNCFLLCSKIRWFVLLTWKHLIRWLSSTILIVPLIQSGLTLELTGRSGSGSLANIHFGRHATPPLAYQHPKLGNNHQAPLVKLYICFKNAPMCNQPSPTAGRNPADSTPADWWGGGQYGDGNTIAPPI